MLDHIFLSPLVKQSMVISNKHGIYELSLKLLNNLRLNIFGNQEILEKSHNLSELFSLVLSLPPEMNFFSILAKNLREIEIRHFPQCPISYENQTLSEILSMIVSGKNFLYILAPDPLHLIYLTILVTLRLDNSDFNLK